jgi:parvulin-like peptidyl-prolyl isomerase
MRKYIDIESQAWDRLILLAEAKKRKINATNKEVIALLQDYPLFKKAGRFNDNTYLEMLKYVFRTQPRAFEEQIRDSLILAKLYNAVTEAISLNDEEIKEAYKKENEQISIYYLAGLFSETAKEVAASEEEIKDYFTKNSFKFKQPPSFNIEYISIPAEGKETAIRDKINKILLGLNKKMDFAKVAKDLGLEIKETGPFAQTDPIPGIGWSPQIFSLVSKLKTGQYSAPIYTDKYYYILKLKEKRDAYIPDFEIIKEKVKQALISEESKETAKEKMRGCLKKIKELDFKAVNFEGIAKEYGLKYGFTDLFKYGSYIEGIGASDRFWTAASGLKEKQISELIETPEGFYIIKLKSRVPLDEKKFSGEKAGFSEKLLLQKKQEHFLKFVEQLRKETQVFLY